MDERFFSLRKLMKKSLQEWVFQSQETLNKKMCSSKKDPIAMKNVLIFYNVKNKISQG